MSTKFYGPHTLMHVTHAETDTSPGVFFPGEILTGAPAFSHLRRECACHRIYTDHYLDSVVDVFVWFQSVSGNGKAVFQVEGFGDPSIVVVEFPDQQIVSVRMQVAEGFELFGSNSPTIDNVWGTLMRLDRLIDHMEQTLEEPVAVVRTEVVGVA